MQSQFGQGVLSITPEAVESDLRRALALYLCHHDLRPCRVCLALVDPLVRPIARAFLYLGFLDVKDKIKGYQRAGSAVNMLMDGAPNGTREQREAQRSERLVREERDRREREHIRLRQGPTLVQKMIQEAVDQMTPVRLPEEPERYIEEDV